MRRFVAMVMMAACLAALSATPTPAAVLIDCRDLPLNRDLSDPHPIGCQITDDDSPLGSTEPENKPTSTLSVLDLWRLIPLATVLGVIRPAL